MVILRTRNKITDFFMILAWASPFKYKGGSKTSGDLYSFFTYGFKCKIVKYYFRIKAFILGENVLEQLLVIIGTIKSQFINPNTKDGSHLHVCRLNSAGKPIS